MKHCLTERAIRYFIPNIGTLILVALMLLVYRASAAPNGPAAPDATPGTISYQGMLNDAAGQPINGSTNITFRLYSVPTGGTALWTEAHSAANAVPVSNGLFNVLLGSLTPIPASVWSNANVYLGVQVGGDAEMSPREVIGDVPVAQMALSVPDGSVTSDKLQLTAGSISITSDQDVQLSSTIWTPVVVPDTIITISLNTNSRVMFWYNSTIQSPPGANDDTDLIFQIDGHNAFVSSGMQAHKFNLGGAVMTNLTPGTHIVRLVVQSPVADQHLIFLGGRTTLMYQVVGQ